MATLNELDGAVTNKYERRLKEVEAEIAQRHSRWMQCFMRGHDWVHFAGRVYVCQMCGKTRNR